MRLIFKKFRKTFAVTAALCLLLVGAGCTRTATEPPHNSAAVQTTYRIPLLIGRRRLNVAIADTDAARAQGLSGQPRLQDDQGMLFDFHGTSITTPGFWMKNMKFNLDLIWIKDNEVIGITTNVPAPRNPGEPLPSYYPPSQVDMVLEVNAGWSDSHGIVEGEKIRLEK
jgi:uncharacterized membrane protein (UPF0127 family)